MQSHLYHRLSVMESVIQQWQLMFNICVGFYCISMSDNLNDHSVSIMFESKHNYQSTVTLCLTLTLSRQHVQNFTTFPKKNYIIES